MAVQIARAVPRVGLMTNVQTTTKTTAFNTSSTTFVDVTGLSVSITPQFSNSKILIIASIYGSITGVNTAIFNLLRGSTNIAQPASAIYSGSMGLSMGASNTAETIGFTYLDSPATTSATTYKIQARVSAGTIYVCQRSDDTTVTTASTITAIEVLQ